MSAIATDDVRISKACGYFLIRRDSRSGAHPPIELGMEWPDVAVATSDRSKSALVIEKEGGALETRVLNGVSDWEAVDAAERLARVKGAAAVYVARFAGTIGKEAPSNIWQRIKRFSTQPLPEEKKAPAPEGFKEVHFQLKRKAAAGDELRIEGWASTKNIDRDGEIVEPRSVEKTLAGSMPSLLLHFNHNADFVVGKVESIELKDDGMWLVGRISKATNPPQVRTWIEEETVGAMSIRFIVLEDKFDDAGVRHITKAELLEVSVVTMPSNRQSTFSLVKGITDGTDLSCSRCHDSHCGGNDHIPFKRWSLAEKGFTVPAGQDVKAGVLRAGGWDLYRDANAVYRPAQDSDDDAYRKAGSYLLQHHAMVDGGMQTVLELVQKCMVQTLSKSTDLTSEDRHAAYEHLAKHLEEFGETPPAFEVDDAKAAAWFEGVVYCKQQSAASQSDGAHVETDSKMSEKTLVTTTPAPVAASSPAATVSASVPAPVPALVVDAVVQAPSPAPAPNPMAGYVKIDQATFAKLQRYAEGMSADDYVAAAVADPAVLNETAELIGIKSVKQ